jgi:hypothetical protein
MDDTFGVILVLPACAFAAELERATINAMMEGIDDTLTQQGAPDEVATRSTMMMENALVVSEMLRTGQIEQVQGYDDIAYSFVYAFAKALGFDQISQLRGMTGSLIHNRLRLNPCLSDIDFKQETAHFTNKMKDHRERGDDEWDMDMVIPQTIH